MDYIIDKVNEEDKYEILKIYESLIVEEGCTWNEEYQGRGYAKILLKEILENVKDRNIDLVRTGHIVIDRLYSSKK